MLEVFCHVVTLPFFAGFDEKRGREAGLTIRLLRKPAFADSYACAASSHCIGGSRHQLPPSVVQEDVLAD